jgi:hypothetical protein
LSLLAALDREDIRAKHPAPALMGIVGALLRLFKRKVVTNRGKLCLVCYEINSKQRRTNTPDPLRDGSEGGDFFLHRARPAKHGKPQIVAA